MDYKELAGFLVDQVGGEENISTVTHCATRLRFVLADEGKANIEAIKARKGVLNVVKANGQFQVIIGQQVNDAFKALEELLGTKETELKDVKSQKQSSLFNRILEGVASLFAPSIYALTGGGLLKAFVYLFAALGLLSKDGQTYLLLSYISDAPFYFLPFLLAYGTAKRFKGDIGLALTMAGVLLYPSISTLFADGAGVKFFHIIPVRQVNYSSTVMPIILTIIFMCYAQKFFEKYIPNVIKVVGVPLLTCFVTSIVGLSILGPIGSIASDLLFHVFTFLDAHVSWLVPTLIGAFMPYMVMTGTHLAVTPLAVQAMSSVGQDSVVGPGGLASNLAVGTAAVAVGILTKEKSLKELALSSGFSGLLGITEPALYGVNMKLKYPLYASMIGGGCAGLFLGINHVGRYAMGPSSLIMLPAYIGGDSMMNFYMACVGAAISIVVTLIASVFLFKHNQKKALA